MLNKKLLQIVLVIFISIGLIPYISSSKLKSKNFKESSESNKNEKKDESIYRFKWLRTQEREIRSKTI